MSRILTLGAALAGAVFAISASVAQAATIMTFDETVNGAPPKPMTMTLGADRLQLNSALFELIYRGDQGKVWLLQPTVKTYMEFSPAAMAPMAAKINAAKAMMQRKLAALPEAQRKQVEAMMAKHMGAPAAAAPPAAATYTKAGDVRQVGAWSCMPYHVTFAAKFASDACIAKLEDVGLTRDDLSAFASFGAFMGKARSAMSRFNSPMATMDLDSMTKAIGFVGFPVQMSSKVGIIGKQIVTTLKSVDHQDAPAGSFEIPAGYTKLSFRGMLSKMGAPG